MCACRSRFFSELASLHANRSEERFSGPLSDKITLTVSGMRGKSASVSSGQAKLVSCGQVNIEL